MKLIDSSTSVLVSQLNDPEEPFSAELEQTAIGVTRCLTNVLKSASGVSQAVTPVKNENKVSSKVRGTSCNILKCIFVSRY